MTAVRFIDGLLPAITCLFRPFLLLSHDPTDALAALDSRKTGIDSEALSREAVEAYQLKKLQDTLNWCFERSPFYREQLLGYPRNMRSLEEWQAYPLTTAGDVRKRPFSFVCVSQSDVERVVTLETSGTSGPPKRLYFTAEDQELTRDYFHHGMSTFTTAGDRVLILLHCARLGSVGDLLDQALTRLRAEGIRHGLVTDVAETLRVLRQEEATVVVGVPVQVLSLVRSTAAQQMTWPRLESVLLTVDHVPEAVAQAVESTWCCTVFNHYGMTEMGLGGGLECEARRGYHLREADLFYEIIDPLTGEMVPDGQFGEIVFTTLTRRAMPLIRYRTGDVSRFLSGTCACGTVLRHLEKVRYRWNGRVPLAPDLFLTIADLDDALFELECVCWILRHQFPMAY